MAKAVAKQQDGQLNAAKSTKMSKQAKLQAVMMSIIAGNKRFWFDVLRDAELMEAWARREGKRANSAESPKKPKTKKN